MILSAPQPQDLILVGASGNLARKKLLPALYNLGLDGLLPERGSLIGFSKDQLDDEALRNLAAEAVKDYSRRTFPAAFE